MTETCPECGVDLCDHPWQHPSSTPPQQPPPPPEKPEVPEELVVVTTDTAPIAAAAAVAVKLGGYSYVRPPWESDERASKYGGLRAVDLAFMRIYINNLFNYLENSDSETIIKRFKSIRDEHPLGYRMGTEDLRADPDDTGFSRKVRPFQRFSLLDAQEELPMCLYDKLNDWPAYSNFEYDREWYFVSATELEPHEHFGGTLADQLKVTNLDHTCMVWMDFKPK